MMQKNFRLLSFLFRLFVTFAHQSNKGRVKIIKTYIMKRYFLTLLVLVTFVMSLQAQIQVAILEPVKVTGDVTMMQISMVRGEMVKAIGRQSGYAAFTRQDIDKIMMEHNFQASGMVDDATRKRIGALQGVDYVCITKITKEGSSYYLEASLVNIETGQISNPATQYGELVGGSLANMLKSCEVLAMELVGGTPQYSNNVSNKIDGHEYVDLGLSVKWATCNVGTLIPEGYGDYLDYSQACNVRWGSGWRLPNKAELEELKVRCTWKWTTQNGVKGYEVTGPNGNSIFLPAAGYRGGSSLCSVGSGGFYWSSTPYDCNIAWYLYFYSGGQNLNNYNRSYGQSVRLVSE